jgi:flagellar protein FlgJ
MNGRNFSEFFSDSNLMSMRRLLAFEFAQVVIILGLLMSIKLGWVNQEAAAHVMETFATLIGLLLGLTTVSKIPSAIDWIKSIRKKKPEDDELKPVDVPDPAPAPAPTTPEPDPAPEPAPEPTPVPEPVPAPPPTQRRDKKAEFVGKFYLDALASQKVTGINAIAILAQAAHETGWKLNPPGNMFFGIKANSKTPKNKKQLLTTHEVLMGKKHSFPEIISITPTNRKGQYRYKVRDWFRKYDSPADSFTDHGTFLAKNRRYAKAMAVRNDAHKFFEEIAKAGYATDPSYAKKLSAVAKSIEGLLSKVG